MVALTLKLKIHTFTLTWHHPREDISHKPSWSWWGQFLTPASSLPLAPASTPSAVWDPPSGLCLLPPYTVPGLGSLLCLSFLPSLGSQDGGPLARSPGPAHLVQFFLSPLPIKLCSLHPFPETSLSSAQSNLASTPQRRGRAHLEATFSRPPLLPRPTRAPLCPTLQPQGLHSDSLPSAASVAPSA